MKGKPRHQRVLPVLLKSEASRSGLRYNSVIRLAALVFDAHDSFFDLRVTVVYGPSVGTLHTFPLLFFLNANSFWN
jgi:hypothetical protein